MGSISLPALDVKTPSTPNLMDQYASLLKLQSMRQNVQQQQDMAPLQQQQAQQATQSGQLQLQQQQQQAKDQQSFRAAAADPAMADKTIGQVADVLAKKGQISQDAWAAAKKSDIDSQASVAKLNETQLAAMKAGHEATQQLYNNVMDMPDAQLAASWPQIAQQYDAIPGNNKTPLNPQQPMTKQQLQSFGPLLSMNGAYLDQEVARRKAVTDSQTAQANLRKTQAETAFYDKNGGAPGVPVEAQQQADWLSKNPGKGPSDFAAWKAKQSPFAVIMGNQMGGSQNSQALDFAADNYRKSGQMPPALSRSPGTTIAIIQRAAQLDQQDGGGGIATNKAVLASNVKSLDSLQKNYDQVQAFEGTASRNIDLLQQTAAKIPDLGSRFANVPVRMLNSKMLGTENMAAFNTALNTAQTEAAKVLNSSNASGVLSDSARHELQQIVDGNMPYKSMVASLNTLKQDMSNRTQAYQAQIEDIQSRIKGAGTSPTSAPASSAPSGGNDPFAQFGGKAH